MIDRDDAEMDNMEAAHRFQAEGLGQVALRFVFRPKACDNLGQGNALGIRRTARLSFQAGGLGQPSSQAFGLE